MTKNNYEFSNYLKRNKISTTTFLTGLGILVATGGVFGSYMIINKNNYVDHLPVYMSEVIDGDTFKLESGEIIRLSNIDAPETDSCGGKEAKEYLEIQLRGKALRLEKDIQGQDNFGRLVRYVIAENKDSRTDNIFINKDMLEKGYAQYKSSDNLKYKSEFVKAESKAQSEIVGIWENCPEKANETKTASRTERSDKPTDPKCDIKGNISAVGLGKTFFLPHCANYDNTKIDFSKGEKYFCTREEAEAEGFRIAEGCR